MLSLLLDVALCIVVIAGLGALFLRPLRDRTPPEQIILAIAGGLLLGFFALLALFATGLSLRWFAILPALGLLSAIVRPDCRAVLRDVATRAILFRWAIFALWCLGWQSTVITYNGAAWHGDWFEHYDRAHFFLARWPKEFLFLDVYPLPARPPLFNLWTAGLMSIAGGSFTHYQTFATLLNSLVFLPCALLLHRWQPATRAMNVLLVLCMANPLIVQNATFTWTKLASAFFVLLALSELLNTKQQPLRRVAAAAALLGGGMLTHYSAGPWILAFAAGYAWLARHDANFPLRPRHVAVAAGCGALVFAPWLLWSLANYGFETTFVQNSAVAIKSEFTTDPRLIIGAKNAFHTLWPVSVGLDHPLLHQLSPLGRFRDFWFLHYQLKLPWTFGLAGFGVIAGLLLKSPPTPRRGCIVVSITAAIAAASIAHATPDFLGLAHVGLQPLVLLGLVYLAANTDRLVRWARGLLVIGIALDLLLGIVLHFGVQSFKLDLLLSPDAGNYAQRIAQYTSAARAGFESKNNLQLVFLADGIPFGAAITMLLLAALLAAALFGLKIASPRSPAAP